MRRTSSEQSHRGPHTVLAPRPPPPPPCTYPLGRTVPLAYNAPLYPYAVEALEGVDRADMLEGGERVGEGGGR